MAARSLGLLSRGLILAAFTVLVAACSDDGSPAGSAPGAAGASAAGQGGASGGGAATAGSNAGGSAGAPTGPLFANLSFEDVDEGGAPKGWLCMCVGDTAVGPCKTEAPADAPDGARVLVLAPRCAAYQDAARSLLPSTSVTLQLAGDSVAASQGQSAMYGFYQDDEPPVAQLADQPTPGPGSWSTLRTSRAVNTDGLTRLRVILSNGGTTGSVHFDDVHALDDQPAIPAKTATLLTAEHYMNISVTSGPQEAQLWAPLPLDYATQTPLYLEFSVEPPEAASQIDYQMDGSTNWGAVVHFAPDTVADKVAITWKAVVLTRAIASSERPGFYAATDDPASWLAATPDANFNDPTVSAVATSLAAPGASARDRMLSVIGWTSGNIDYSGKFKSLDASEAIGKKAGSCTGFGNAASALGRALGVPTRAVANILVGEPQQIHSINEFYLGSGLGWRRVEPQSPLPSVEEDGYLPVRLVTPDDESSQSFSPPIEQWGWTSAGVPLRTLDQPLAGAKRLSALFSPHFPTCDSCSNGARVQATIYGDSAQVQDTFAQARASWQKDLPAYLAGGLAPGRMSARRAATQAASLAHVQALLASLP